MSNALDIIKRDSGIRYGDSNPDGNLISLSLIPRPPSLMLVLYSPRGKAFGTLDFYNTPDGHKEIIRWLEILKPISQPESLSKIESFLLPLIGMSG